MPGGNIIITGARIFAEQPLDGVAAVVQDKDHRLRAETGELANFLYGELMGAFAGDEQHAAVRRGDRSAERSRRRPADRAPQALAVKARSLWQSREAEAHRHGAG